LAEPVESRRTSMMCRPILALTGFCEQKETANNDEESGQA